MVGIYARQSVDKKDSISIETQIAECQKELSEGENFQVYSDRGCSGKNTNREQFQSMMEDVKQGRISKVIVYKVDRISRAIIDFAGIMSDFDKFHVDFISRNEKFDTTTPIGRAMLTIIMVFAQLERETIQQRITDNYYARAEQGFYLGGRQPFGFTLAKTELNGKKTSMYVPKEDEIEVLKMLYKKYGEDGQTLNPLVGWLNSEPIRQLSGKQWSGAMLSRILRNPIYVQADAEVYSYLENKGAHMNDSIADFKEQKGCYVYGNKGDRTSSKFADLSKSFVTLALHDGVIPADLWLTCQRKLDGNKQIKNMGKGSYSWLSGSLWCKYCGYSITAVCGKGKSLYLTCGGRKNKVCYERKRVIRINEVESIVEKELLNYIKQLSVQAGQIQDATPDTEINQLKIEICLIDEKVSTYMEKVLSAGDALMALISTEIDKLDKERKKLVAQLETKKFENMRPDTSSLDLQECVRLWSQYNREERKALAKIFIKKVNISDEEIEVVFY